MDHFPRLLACTLLLALPLGMVSADDALQPSYGGDVATQEKLQCDERTQACDVGDDQRVRTRILRGTSFDATAEMPPSTVPCSDPAGCPDLRIDPRDLRQAFKETRTFGAGHCAVIEGATVPGTRHLLRFPTASANLGDGDLIVGAPADHPDWFIFSPCHSHYHFTDYVDYRLWTMRGWKAWDRARAADPDAMPEDVMATDPRYADHLLEGRKQGFCVIDIRSYWAVPSKYHSCSTDQGITAGWADVYGAYLDGQWVDITDVGPGRYVLEVEINPGRVYDESDYANNRAAIRVRI
ncbi:MAG: lysyl oxidase family protein [Thermoplasmatota archaeon]